MTEILTRPTVTTGRTAETAAGARSSIWWRGCLAALWATSLGLATLVVVALVAWAADSRAGASAVQAIRTALQIWLSAHKVPLAVSGGSISVAPLLLTLGLGFLVARAAAVLARGHAVGDGAGVATVAVAVGLPYAALATFVAAAANTDAVRPAPVAALVGGLVLGVVAAGWGAARGAGLVRQLWRRVPEAVQAPVGAGAAAAAVLLGGATLLVLAAGALHLDDAVTTVDSLGGGVVAAAGLVALDLALLPNAVVCAVSYLAGPGFAVGTASTVTMSAPHVATLPSLPLLVAVPHHPAGTAVVAVGIAVLVAAGLAAAWLVARAGEPLVRSTLSAVAAGAVAGTLVALLAVLAGGSAGPGDMSAVGASAWQAGLAVAGEVAVVAAGATAVLAFRRGR